MMLAASVQKQRTECGISIRCKLWLLRRKTKLSAPIANKASQRFEERRASGTLRSLDAAAILASLLS
jgi:hypothetical protein